MNIKKSSKIYILFDEGNTPLSSFISSNIKDCIDVYSPKKKHKIEQWLLGVIKVLSLSSNGDIVICWYDFQAIICFWICKLFFLKRNIICVNILLKDKKTLKNRIVSQLYKKALQSPNFKASVTSDLYGKWLNKKLGIIVNYSLIHDVYRDSYKYNKTGKVVYKSVFCGGRNGRDWDFIIKVAESLPNVRFDLIMPGDIYKKYENNLSENINIKCDVTYDEFMRILCQSTLVCLPLDTEAPAGLIVLFQAAANHKMVITTNTVTTQEYITEDRGVLLPNSVEEVKNAIEYYLKNDSARKFKADNLYNFLKNECSEKDFVRQLKKVICNERYN